MAVERTGNLLLDAMPAPVRELCIEEGERVQGAVGEEIARQGERVRRAFFPSTAICSLTVSLESGDKAEMATIGAEGFVGIALMDGPGTSPTSAVVHVPGEGLMVSLAHLAQLVPAEPAFRRALIAYNRYLLGAAARLVACNAYHSIEERLARWLLGIADRVASNGFPLTHDILSQVLAATRPRVSLAAGKLRAAGIIDYRRGFVRILERRKLEQVSCECYAAIKRQQQALPWLR